MGTPMSSPGLTQGGGWHPGGPPGGQGGGWNYGGFSNLGNKGSMGIGQNQGNPGYTLGTGQPPIGGGPISDPFPGQSGGGWNPGAPPTMNGGPPPGSGWGQSAAPNPYQQPNMGIGQGMDSGMAVGGGSGQVGISQGMSQGGLLGGALDQSGNPMAAQQQQQPSVYFDQNGQKQFGIPPQGAMDPNAYMRQQFGNIPGGGWDR